MTNREYNIFYAINYQGWGNEKWGLYQVEDECPDFFSRAERYTPKPGKWLAIWVDDEAEAHDFERQASCKADAILCVSTEAPQNRVMLFRMGD